MNRMIRWTAIAAALAASFGVQAATIKLSCSSVGIEQQLCKEGAAAWAAKTGNEVQVIATPNDSNERLALYQQILSSGSDKIDIFQIDVIWPGLLADHLLDLKSYANGAEKDHFSGIIANNTVSGKLVGMPWFADAGLVFYRKDLLEKYKLTPPATWADLATTAKKVQDGERAAGNDKMWGFVWQGRAYEGLTCNALEWVVSNGGGSIVDETGKVTINNAQAAAALDQAASWVGSITPKAVLNYAEEEGRGVFQAGNAVFIRSWPYVWGLGQAADSPIKDKIGVMAAPKGAGNGARKAAALGGQELAVSKYSKNAKLAADLVMYLTSKEEQKRRSIKGGFNPTIGALYRDAEMLKANPFLTSFAEVLEFAVGRPAYAIGSKYNQASNLFWNAAHDVLAGQAKGADAVAKLEKELGRLAPGGKWK